MSAFWWYVVLWAVRLVVGALFFLMAFGWAVGLLTMMGRFRYVPWR